MDGRPVTACLVLGMQAEGKEITTIEGLGTIGDLHPIQDAYIEEQGFQCGFCTPGFIMVTKAFLDENPDPDEAQAAGAISGNICRCGAYPFIVRSVLTAARKLESGRRRAADRRRDEAST
jgi:carbon-monoxide dehydrogenase small subunit